ncbi:MAG TPA: tRNA pseudouridine(55) synthase TruB [Gemmatimonadota bacterium]|nr:tRNA pseudouridine(55) synthase TruB [Gemmatimonadota bacterium]
MISGPSERLPARGRRRFRGSGILLLDKPVGPTSHDAVAAVRRALGTRRVGHFGTLDPFASGLLVCGAGGATRLAPFAADHERTYRGTVRLGWRSTTDDPEGELEAAAGATPPSRDDVERACRAWVGEVGQVPPAYSAKHLSGARAYARARAGERFVLPEARIMIRSIVIERYVYPELDLQVTCGPGTYIRALARDLGEALGVGGYCAALRRERTGPFAVGEAVVWEALPDWVAVRAALLPAESVVVHLPVAELDAAGQIAAVQGRSLPLPDGLPPDSSWVRLRGPVGFIGLAEVRDGSRLQPRRILTPGDGAVFRKGRPSVGETER